MIHNKRLERIYVVSEFKKYLYQLKSNEPNKTLSDLSFDLMKRDQENKNNKKEKKNEFWFGKI